MFLLFRNGIQQRRNSFEDGVYGTTCPIPPGKNFTYILQMKDQIGSFYYFPSLAFHKAAGGFGGIKILSRPRIPVPFDEPADDFTVLIGDWYKSNHTVSIIIFYLSLSIFLCSSLIINHLVTLVYIMLAILIVLFWVFVTYIKVENAIILLLVYNYVLSSFGAKDFCTLKWY